MSGELLLEIGTEEIPSDYLEKGLRQMKRLADAYMVEHRIQLSEPLVTMGTPRRLVLMGKAMGERQEDVVQEISGPPKNAAFDKAGKPTKAALGFAAKCGVSVNDLELVETPRGQYVCVKKRVPGRPTRDVLAEIIPRLVADIPWPKSMRWGCAGFPFVRPIHWVLAIFGGEVIPFQVAGVSSDNKTRGHRFMNPETVEVAGFGEYLQKMAEGAVIIDPDERRQRVKEVVLEAANTVSGIPDIDSELLATVANLVEYPSAVCGSFEGSFLKLPDPVLITPMKEHQRYFPVRNKEGRLMPYFIAVNNTVSRNPTVVRKGHERVLRARLSDADFFFKEDRKHSIGDRLEDLKGVIYQAELGTSYAKVQRFARLAEYLTALVAPDRRDEVLKAAYLCKCDLVTEMVMEFPSLQGTMGREYARLEGYPDEICHAIRDHYLPTKAGDELPSSTIGSIVGMADRMDTITGCFAIQLEPTGSADPFALRRHALAVIRILEGKGWNISLEAFIRKSLSILGEEITLVLEQVFNRVLDFFQERYKRMMLRSGYEHDLVEAVISVAFDRIHGLRHRIDQLKKFAEETEGFESLVLTFKRVANILKNQETASPVNRLLFREPCESVLWEIYQDMRGEVDALLEKGKYFEALTLMMRLKRPVDNFFDGVAILTKEDAMLRENRVGLLQDLERFFLKMADFSKFSI